MLDLMVMARGGGGSTSASPYSSYHPSPYASSYDPSPVSSSFPSPVRTNNDDNAVASDNAQDSSLFPWLNNLLPSSSSSSFPNHLFLLHAGGGGSISAPVTPPFTSTHYHWFAGAQSGPSSPTFNLVSRNPFGPLSQGGSGSRIWTHNQSGTCSPAADASVGGVDHKTSDVPMPDSIETEFAFGQVKPWKGERIHEGCIPDDLQLTLGNSTTRYQLH